MDQLRKQVARARRRLIIEQFLSRLIWCLLGALSLAAIAIAVPRVAVIENLPANWDYGWLIGGFAAAVVVAGIWTFISNRSPIDAAIEIDRRFDLRERVASSLSLSPEEQSSEAGRAVMNDALHAIGRIDVDEKFRVGVGRRAWWPLVPAAIVFALVAFVDNRQASSSVDPTAAAKMEQQTKNALDSFRKKLEEQRKKLAEEKGLKAADEMFKQIEEGTRELTQKEKLDPSKAHVKLNDLAKELEQKRQQAGRRQRAQRTTAKNERPGRRPRRQSGPGDEAGRLEQSLARNRQARQSSSAKASSTKRRRSNLPSSSRR